MRGKNRLGTTDPLPVLLRPTDHRAVQAFFPSNPEKDSLVNCRDILKIVPQASPFFSYYLLKIVLDDNILHQLPTQCFLLLRRDFNRKRLETIDIIFHLSHLIGSFSRISSILLNGECAYKYTCTSSF